MKEIHIANFNRIFEKNYTSIVNNTQSKYLLQTDTVRSYVHDAYYSIMKTMEKGKKEYPNLTTDISYLKYIYYSVNSTISNDGKKKSKENIIPTEFEKLNIKADSEELIGIDLFYQDALIELEKIFTAFEMSIWKPIFLYGFTMYSLKKSTDISHRVITKTLNNCKEKIENNKHLFDKLKTLYLDENDFYQDEYIDLKKQRND
jgi:hypothetical protein